MRNLGERSSISLGRALQGEYRYLSIEGLEDRRLLSVTAITSQLYLKLIPDAVLMAREFVSNHPALTGDVESWFAEEDNAEAASGIEATVVELTLAPASIPAGMPIELVEEMMEDLIEDGTASQDVVEVIFDFGSVAASAVPFAVQLQPSSRTPSATTPLVAVEAELHEFLPGLTRPALSNESAFSDETIAVVEQMMAKQESGRDKLNLAVDAQVSEAANMTAANTELNESVDDASRMSDPQSSFIQASAHELIEQNADDRSSFLEHLRADFQAVDESIEAMYEYLQSLREDVSEWLGERPVPLWAKVTFGTAVTLVAWSQRRRWHERRVQPHEEAVDWILWDALNQDGAAS